jgi:prepilin-type N-terminal cleavage/methylation domain-containing protein
MMQKKIDAFMLGFTLVELMITVVIIGILAGIAIPSYKGYLRRSLLAEGYQGVDVVVKSQTMFFLQHKEFKQFQTSGYVPSPNKELVTLNGVWASVYNSPFPVGSAQQFLYVTTVGKNNGSGDPIRSSPLNESLMESNFGYIPSNDKVGVRCNNLTASEYYNENVNQPYRNWVFIFATANLVEDPVPTSSKCTHIFKVLDTNEKGSIKTSAFMGKDLGE